jgi:hypothetical protein
MKKLLALLMVAAPAFADWPSLESSCELHQIVCYADLAKRVKECKVKKTQTAKTSRGKVTFEWRRCPISGFSTVRGADYLEVTDEEGGIWAFNNVVDPTAAVVADVGFLGKRVLLVQAFKKASGAQIWCPLSLASDIPHCLIPDMADIDERAQKLLKPGETLQGSDWRMQEQTLKNATAVRDIFKEGEKKASAVVEAVLYIGRDRLKIDSIRRR